MQAEALDEAAAVDRVRARVGSTRARNARDRGVDVGGVRRRCPSSSATGSGDTSSASTFVAMVVVDRLDVVRLVGLEQQQRVGTVVRAAEPGEEVRVARRDDAVDGRPAGVPVVGVQAVALPRVVTEHDVGPHLRGSTSHTDARARRAALELAVDEAAEVHRSAPASVVAAAARFVDAGRDERVEVVGLVPACPSSRR